LCDVGRVAVTNSFKLEVFFTFIFAVLLHLLIFRVDVDYSLISLARELKNSNISITQIPLQMFW